MNVHGDGYKIARSTGQVQLEQTVQKCWGTTYRTLRRCHNFPSYAAVDTGQSVSTSCSETINDLLITENVTTECGGSFDAWIRTTDTTVHDTSFPSWALSKFFIGGLGS